MLFSGHPHALTLARLRLRSAQVSQDNVTVKAASIDILGGSIEARAAIHNTLTLALLTLTPNVLTSKQTSASSPSMKKDEIVFYSCAPVPTIYVYEG